MRYTVTTVNVRLQVYDAGDRTAASGDVLCIAKRQTSSPPAKGLVFAAP